MHFTPNPTRGRRGWVTVHRFFRLAGISSSPPDLISMSQFQSVNLSDYFKYGFFTIVIIFTIEVGFDDVEIRRFNLKWN